MGETVVFPAFGGTKMTVEGEEYGIFDQSSKANGAHYAPAAKNPFIGEGMVCGNCVFFIGGGKCEIVSGNIEPNAICKLWIIPEQLIKVRQ